MKNCLEQGNKYFNPLMLKCHVLTLQFQHYFLSLSLFFSLFIYLFISYLLQNENL